MTGDSSRFASSTDSEVEPSSYVALIALGKQLMQSSSHQMFSVLFLSFVWADWSSCLAATCRHLLYGWHSLRGVSTHTCSLEGFAPKERRQNTKKTSVFR